MAQQITVSFRAEDFCQHPTPRSWEQHVTTKLREAGVPLAEGEEFPGSFPGIARGTIQQLLNEDIMELSVVWSDG
ncbi:MAG: hypothetical protein KGI54_08415 [Pseudomonadota bacterium]|nr:hypothetical protein [Pseudomonadota bacterium]